jgi:LysR family hydrogen peroxide-inducible transcriptional activator
VGPYLFPDLIGKLHKLAPAMPLVVEENYTAVLGEKLKQGELDVIVISLPFSGANILTVTVYEEPFVVLLPADHPLAAKRSLRPEALEGERILMLGAGHCFRDQVIEACPACAPTATAKNEYVYTVEGSSLETIRHMVASGMGLTVLPSTATGADRYSKKLLTVVPFVRPSPGREVALGWRASFPRPRVVEVLRTAISASLARGARPAT